MTDIEKDVLQEMLERRKKELASCERMLELLQPEWDKFEARTGHDVYVARDYADHFSAARTHRKEIAALGAAIAAMQPAPQEPVAWMYEYGGGTVACTTTRYEPAVLSALGYTETPLYAFPTPPAGGSDAE